MTTADKPAKGEYTNDLYIERKLPLVKDKKNNLVREKTVLYLGYGRSDRDSIPPNCWERSMFIY
jgi:hypothetical protein